MNLNHKNLDVWKLSVDFVTHIYKLTATFPKDELYGITSQIRRAAVSIPSNIAEGAARKSGIERKRFYEIARSSLVEIDSQIEISPRLNYCKQVELNHIGDEMNHIFAMLSNLINKTR